ncbi:isochorismatase family protein [Pseudaestuariivita sp.]|uniref:isochorismatase family protein n=1 Tax=Pseudaestuariivita sp. TaxID=2211669 RepID=UPI004058A15A
MKSLVTSALVASALFTLAATAASAQDRPADIVSPITDGYLAPEIGADAALANGTYAYVPPTPDNAIMLFIDHQIGLMAGIRDFNALSEYKNNVVGLAKIADALDIPVLLTTSNAQWQNGDILPELKEIFADAPIYRRTGIINAYADPTFRRALLDLMEETGRTHVIVSGVTIGTCVIFPVLSMLNDGIAHVHPVVDASGAWSAYEADAAMARMSAAGAELQSVFALGAELQADWKTDTATAMLDPFVNHLPEYGFVLQNFWNNAGEAPLVADPFGVTR